MDFFEKNSVESNVALLRAIVAVINSELTDAPRHVSGTAWPKRTKNGRLYFKIEFKNMKTRSGSAVYAKAWPRKNEPHILDIIFEDPSTKLTKQ